MDEGCGCGDCDDRRGGGGVAEDCVTDGCGKIVSNGDGFDSRA